MAVRTNVDESLFVSRYYEMDPASEDLLASGNLLQEGMRVLPGSSANRVDISTNMLENVYDKAMTFNRWCTVTDVYHVDRQIAFVGVYDDGTKRKVFLAVEEAWLVKKNTIPENLLYAPIYIIVRDAMMYANQFSTGDIVRINENVEGFARKILKAFDE